MMEQVLAPENLREAWRRVRANGGPPGMDGTSAKDFPAFARIHWPRIRTALVEGTHRPANITLDPQNEEFESRGHCFARYADDFLVMVESAKAAERVMASLTRFVEGRLLLVVNRTKSKTAPLRQCTFPGFQIGARGRVVWTAKAHVRFKQRVREITRRNRGHRVQDVMDELRRCVTDGLTYFGISHTYNQVAVLAE